MVPLTQPSGPADTLSRSRRDIWGGLEPRLWPLLVTLAIAGVLHVPMLPTSLGYWVRVLFRDAGEVATVDRDAPVQIPIEVDLLGGPPPKPSEPAPAAATPPEPAPPPPAPAEDEDDLLEAFDDAPPRQPAAPPEPADAGVPDAAPETPDAAPPPEPTPEPKAEPKAEPPKRVAKRPRLPRGKLDNAYEVAGEKGAVSARHPNVNVLLASDVLRQRDLSKPFGELLASVPQWEELIGGTGLDPMRDFDRILISGPEFKRAHNIVVAIRYNKSLSAYEMKNRIDKVVARSGEDGQWIEGSELPTAIIGKGGIRYAVIVPHKRVLWILPKVQQEDLALLKDADPFARTPSAGIVLDLKHPYRPLRERGFELPKTISHLRVHFTLEADGYKIQAEAWDKSPDDAALHKAALEAAVDALPKLDIEVLGFKKEIRAIGTPTFEVQGNRIYATAPVSEAQLSRIIKFVKLGVDERKDRKEARDARKRAAAEKLDRARRMIERAEQTAGGAPSSAPPPSASAPVQPATTPPEPPPPPNP